MGETSDKFWGRFSGEVDSGIIFSKGNETTQYNLGAHVAYLRDRVVWRGRPEFHAVLQQRHVVSSHA